MAKEPTKPAEAGERFKPDSMYRVELSEPVEYPKGSGSFFRPGQNVRLRGSVASQFAEKISAATEEA